MNATRDPETVVAAWLDEGPTDLPDVTRRAILTALPITSQVRRGLFAPRRFPQMNPYARWAAAAMVVALSVGGMAYLLGPNRGTGGPPGPTETPAAASAAPDSAEPSPTPQVSYDTTTWLPFTSDEYGFTMAYPSGWQHAPATQAWAGETFAEMWSSDINAPWVDKFYNGATGVTMTAVAIPFAAGTAEAKWINTYMAPPPGATPTSTCVVRAADMSAIVIDGRPGSISTSCEDSRAAFVVKGAHIYVFAISTPSDPALFDAFLSTVRLPKA
jgi:hypothetical protein